MQYINIFLAGSQIHMHRHAHIFIEVCVYVHVCFDYICAYVNISDVYINVYVCRGGGAADGPPVRIFWKGWNSYSATWSAVAVFVQPYITKHELRFGSRRKQPLKNELFNRHALDADCSSWGPALSSVKATLWNRSSLLFRVDPGRCESGDA